MSEYQIIIKPLALEDGGGFLAWVPDLPGCMSDGETIQEATANCREAIGEWIEHAVRLGEEVPAALSRAYA